LEPTPPSGKNLLHFSSSSCAWHIAYAENIDQGHYKLIIDEVTLAYPDSPKAKQIGMEVDLTICSSDAISDDEG